jgi:sulfate permease, SulP family
MSTSRVVQPGITCQSLSSESNADPQRGSKAWNRQPADGVPARLGPIPAVTWLRTYERSWLRFDLVGGIILAAYLLPAALGDASLANLPPQAGLYACLFAGLVFWIFCSSSQTVVSVTSAISLVIGSSLGEISGGNVTRFGSLAAATALLVAVIAFIAWLVKAGVLVHFISESVMTGFKCGVALFLASTQLPKLFGFHAAHGSFWGNTGFFFNHLHETNSMSVVIGGIALSILVVGKIYFKHRPIALVVVIGGIVAASAFSLSAYGVKLIGAVPQGIPPLQLPAVHWRDLSDLLPLALACFLLGAVETAAVGRMFAAKHGGRFDANQENLALSASNLLAGLGGGFPVSGGTSQSLVNESGGARTPLSTAFAGVVILIVIVFLSRLLSALPQPILAAVVLAAVAGLFKVSTLKELWRSDRQEFLVAVAAFIGVLTFGLLLGVMIGVVISLVQLAHASAHPHVALLGRIPGTRRFSDYDRHPDNELIPGVMIFRPESSLLYFNIDNVSDLILGRVFAEVTLPAMVVIDLSAAPSVDLQSAHTLAAMANELTANGIRFQAVEERSSVRDRLRHEGIDRKLGGVNRFTTVVDVIDHFLNETAASGSDSNAARRGLTDHIQRS